MSNGAIFMLIVGASFPALLIVALVVKLLEVRRAKRWPETTGKVVANGVLSTRQEADSGRLGETVVKNEPLVEYEYRVDGKTYRNRRITIGEKTSGHELEAILARYPHGATVTVYYDPANPQTAVLERDLFTMQMWAGFGCLMLFFIGGPLLAAFFYFNGVEWLKPHVAHPYQAPFVAALGGFGLLLVLFALGLTGMVWQAARWPVVRGQILDAGVADVLDTRGDGPSRTQYQASVLYAYEVNGRRYQGTCIMLGVTVFATLPGLAQWTVARYPVGSEVEVHYNPQNPGEAVLQPHSWLHYLPWLLALAVFTLTWAIATGRLG